MKDREDFLMYILKYTLYIKNELGNSFLELGNHVPTPDYGERFWEILLMEIPWNGVSTRKE